MLRVLGKPVRLARKAIYVLRNRWFDNFIFIHINKTGGSSVEKALKLHIEHKTVKEKIKQIGQKNWDQRTSFAIVRNPWDKVVSHYHYRVQTNITNLGRETIQFSEWVERTYGKQELKYYDNPRMFQPQLDWLTDDSGKIAVDHIIRFENLSIELQKLLLELGIVIKLPHIKSSKRGPYQDYYKPETSEIIRQWFLKDIEQFDYSFELLE